jgi:hypothetical protein
MADGYPKFIPIEQEANHQIGHAFRLRKAHRPMYQPLDPCAQVNMLAHDFLGICLPNRVLLRPHMPLVGTPPVGELTRDTKRLPQRCEFQKDRGLPSSTHIGEDLARVVIDRTARA